MYRTLSSIVRFSSAQNGRHSLYDVTKADVTFQRNELEK